MGVDINTNSLGLTGPAAIGRIFQIIRANSPIPRHVIVAMTGFSKSTVSSHVSKLLNAGLVREDTDEQDNKRKNLKVATDLGFVVGVDLGATSLTVGLFSLELELLSQSNHDCRVSDGPGTIIAMIVDKIRVLLNDNEVAESRLLGIGIGVPGPVEFSKGILYSPPIMPGWDQFELRAAFESEFRCPVLVDNVANVMAVGEQKRGIGKGIEDFIYIKIGTGIGAGIVLNGQIYRGSKGCAGDVGHIAIDGVDTICVCGKTGCLDVVAAGPAIAGRGKELALAGNDEYLREKLEKCGEISCADVGYAADRGNTSAMAIIRESGLAIGNVLAKIVNFYNPSLLVIGGGVANLGDRFISAIREAIYSRSLPLATSELMVRRTTLSDTAGMIGSASMITDYLLSEENVAKMLVDA